MPILEAEDHKITLTKNFLEQKIFLKVLGRQIKGKKEGKIWEMKVS